MESEKPVAKKHRAFIVYLINKTDVDRKPILALSDLLCFCGVDCIIDQYHSNDNILNWSFWVQCQIDECISEGGYILLECSQVMFNILENNPDNPPIKMTKGHIYCQAFRYYLYHNSQNILPFCIDDTSSDFIPRILLERTHYNFPFSKLPQKFTSGSKVSFPNFDHKDVEQLLANPDFASLRSLVATLIKQQEICRPPVCQPISLENVLNLINTITIEDQQQQQYDFSSLMQKIFDRLIQSLPTNSYCVACQIHKNSKFADVFIENDDVLTNCEDQRVVNGYLLWYMYRKCGYDILEFKHAFESTFICQKILPSTDAKYQLLECKKDFLNYFSVFCTDTNMPGKLFTNKGFIEIKQCYHLLIQWMPTNYQLTVEHFKEYLSDDQVDIILNSSHFHSANKKIMDYLIERISFKVELLEFCDQLYKLYTSHFIKAVIRKLKSEIQENEYLLSSDAEVIYSEADVFIPSTSSVFCALSNYNHFQDLPKLPPHYVDRKELLESMVTLCCATSKGDILLVTGAAGYGKSTLIIALCNHNSIREKFANHIIFISLGPQANNPVTKLKKLYFDLTGISNEGVNISEIKVKIKKIIKNCSHNILVVIDDVWHFEDAEPILSAFDKCNVVLSSRKTDMCQLANMNCIKTIDIQQMNLDEAISLLSYNLPEYKMKLNKEALEELAEDARLWPLLLFLVRGQLCHYRKQFNLSCRDSIKCVKSQLHYRGLTAFDKQYSGTNRSRSAKICIELTLQLLTEDDINRFKSLILYAGIGGLYPKLALHSLWNVSKENAEKTANKLFAYGLLSSKHIVLPSYCKVNKDLHCVVTHAVISQYIIDSIMVDQVAELSPHIFSGAENPILKELTCLFKNNYGANDLSQFTPRDYLLYTMHLIEHVVIPYYLKMITMHALHDPYLMLLMLQRLQTTINSSSNEWDILLKFSEKIVMLNSECNALLRNSYNSNRTLNKNIEQDLFEKNYDAMTKTLENYSSTASIGSVASKCIELVKQIMPNAENTLIENFEFLIQMLLMRTHEYHPVNMEKLPLIQKYISLHKEISEVLEKRTDKIWKLYTSLTIEGNFNKELESITENYIITLKRVAPNIEESIKPTNTQRVRL